jgi:hypothetical protein
MPQFIEDAADNISVTYSVEEEHRNEQRRRLTICLDTIVLEVEGALADAGLSRFPVYFCVPSGGPSLLSFITPLDPSDSDWERIGQIICPIVGGKIDSETLSAYEMPCAAASVRIGAAGLFQEQERDANFKTPNG